MIEMVVFIIIIQQRIGKTWIYIII